MVHIIVDEERCIGAAQCVLTAGDVFDQGDDGFVAILDPAPDGPAAEDARVAATLCPSGAITVRED
jgi:ferredoxin